MLRTTVRKSEMSYYFFSHWCHLHTATALVFRVFFNTISDIIIYDQTFYTSECMTSLRVIGFLLWGDSNSSSLNCLLGAKSNWFPSCLTKAAFLLALNTWLSLLFITKLSWRVANVNCTHFVYFCFFLGRLQTGNLFSLLLQQSNC